MTERKSRQSRTGKPALEIATGLLAKALVNRDDYIVTLEIDPDHKKILHIMTGKLITPCMLGTLTNRCELQEGEGSRHTKIKLGRRAAQ
ncbi:MAG: hypothetical protein A4E35_01397 [Methanoregula sp. PtaU1.Bin051]|nr:MAG: hypothetical protein A4E35_01397 [Methanoregula sp. PtaU1.Bin051]